MLGIVQGIRFAAADLHGLSFVELSGAYSPPREEGWLRHEENFGEAHLSAADGVVAHKSKFRCERRLFLMAAPYRACAGFARRPLQ